MFGITFTGSSVDLWVIIIYFIFILGFGSIFGKYTKTTKDFFFGGQRFSWWLISMSCVATLVGSYSFIKYSEYAYKYGTSSSMSYLNDVFIMPLFVFGWLPLIYFSRVTSVPEFFEKRFNKMARFLVTVLIMIYLLGYIGYNLYTMGIAIEKVLGIDIYFAVIATAVVCAIYVAAGGQTAVIMTDLVQGFLLLFAGFLLFGLGLSYVGGFTAFWDKLPVSHRLPFTGVTTPAEFCTAGIFWQDGIANSMVFYFMNQGMILRFLSAKSVKEGRKALIVMALVMMPLTMIAVSNAGWIGKAIPTEEIIQTEIAMENQVLEAKGLPVHPDQPIDPARTPNTKTMFVTVTKLISTPGIFGFIMAALVAALMSTIDTLINASSVIFVNDIWRPYIKPNRADKHYLNVARTFSLLAAFIGVLLVPMFAGFKSLYEAHATFTAAITPPLVAAIVLGAFWKKYTTAGVCATLIGGTIAIGLSFIWPNEILPYFSLGVGPAGYGFMRAFYGLIVSVALGLIFNFLTKPKDMKEIQGYVCGTLRHAVENYKGAPLTKEANGKKGYGMIHLHEDQEKDTVRLPKKMMELLEAEPNDLVYVADKRRWLGGMYSAHLKALEAHDQDNGIWMHPETLAESTLLKHKEVYVEKIL